MARAFSFILVLLFFAVPARAQPIVADISSDVVEITTSFAGAEVIVFGATDGVGDVAVVVKGPPRAMEVRKKGQKGPIWLTKKRERFASVPSVYHIASSKPLSELADPVILDRNNIGIEHIDFEPQLPSEVYEPEPFKKALVDYLLDKRFYSAQVGTIKFQAGRLFRTTLVLPPDVPTGDYVVEAFLFRNGQMVTAQTRNLRVEKVGFSAELSYLAEYQSFLYSLLAIIMALSVGILSGFLFRQR